MIIIHAPFCFAVHICQQICHCSHSVFAVISGSFPEAVTASLPCRGRTVSVYPDLIQITFTLTVMHTSLYGTIQLCHSTNLLLFFEVSLLGDTAFYALFAPKISNKQKTPWSDNWEAGFWPNRQKVLWDFCTLPLSPSKPPGIHENRW